MQNAPTNFAEWAVSVSTDHAVSFNLTRYDGNFWVSPSQLGTSTAPASILANLKESVRNGTASCSRSRLLLAPAGMHTEDSALNIPFAGGSEDSSNIRQSYAESHAAKCHTAVCDLILSGCRDRQWSSALASLLRLSKLVPGEAEVKAEVSGSSDTITAAGLSFCMASKAQQWWNLLWVAIVGVRQVFENYDVNEDISMVIRTLVQADAGLVYHIPPPAANPVGQEDVQPHTQQVARQLLNRLSLVGLCFPFKKRNAELFLVSPFLQLATLGFPTYSKCASIMRNARGELASTSVEKLYLSRPHKAKLGQKRGRGGDTEISDTRILSDRRNCESANIREHTASGTGFDGSVVTETNFRLYVYSTTQNFPTSSAAVLQSSTFLNIISQFADHDITMPHRQTTGRTPLTETFSVFRLTRPAFARAHRRGITADQIIQFLTLKAHPSAPVRVPPSVQDQLFMWQETCERVTWTDTSDPVVLLTFTDEDTLQRVLGLGVPILYRNGLRVAMLHSVFVEKCVVGDIV